MDIAEEIEKHLEWMETIVILLGSEGLGQEELDAVSRHDQCALGQWLLSEASAEFGAGPELEQLKKSHEAFHQLAAEMISALVAGDESKAIDAEKRFIGKSQQVIGHLRALQASQGDNVTSEST